MHPHRGRDNRVADFLCALGAAAMTLQMYLFRYPEVQVIRHNKKKKTKTGTTKDTK
jgi:hypothetical protein